MGKIEMVRWQFSEIKLIRLKFRFLLSHSGIPDIYFLLCITEVSIQMENVFDMRCF